MLNIIHSFCFLLDTSFQFDWALTSKIDTFYYFVLQKFNTKSQECIKRKRLPCDLTEMPQCSKNGKYLAHRVWIREILFIFFLLFRLFIITIIHLYRIGRFALDTNCSCFYTCDTIGKQFIPKLYQCPGSSLYSPTLNRCSYSCKNPPTEVTLFLFIIKSIRYPNNFLIICN